MADFRHQQGLYVLYGNYGPHYVGLTRQSLGNRLKAHTTDHHAGEWERFSWFGFQRVLISKDRHGILRIAKARSVAWGDQAAVIADMEALLIRALGLPSNAYKMNFVSGERWRQIKIHEVDQYLGRLDRVRGFRKHKV